MENAGFFSCSHQASKDFQSCLCKQLFHVEYKAQAGSPITPDKADQREAGLSFHSRIPHHAELVCLIDGEMF